MDETTAASAVPGHGALRRAIASAAPLLVCLATVAIAAQLPDAAHLPPERADRLAGLYELQDGRPAYVLDVRDQLGGRPTLSMIEYGSGRVRALYQRADGSFEAGNAWFRRDRIEYRVRFDGDDGEGPAAGLSWEEAGATLRGTRVPLREREVTLDSGGVRLAGTLVLPPADGGDDPRPGVVMVPGSGPLTRRAPRYVGDLLAWHGVAVLATDKRGTGGSGGEWQGLSHAEWTTDVEAQIDFLRRQPEIDVDRIGLFASSEAGFVAPVVATRRDDVDFLVCRVCSALPHPAVIADETAGRLRRRGLEEAEVEDGVELVRGLMRYALERTGYDELSRMAREGAGTAWWEALRLEELPGPDAGYWDTYAGLLRVDPADHYRRLDIPVLVILGERDDRLLVDEHRRVFRELAEGGTPLTLRVVADATHGLLLTEEDLGVVGYPGGLHHEIAAWVAERAGVAPRRAPGTAGAGTGHGRPPGR